ncbi:alkaline phosphatase family protein, partial [bacterium]|nr:alkaline phosphatase family protein [bacterium]
MKFKTLIIFIVILFILPALIFEIACKGTHSDKKVIILGLDGLDYQIMQGLMAAGKLPNYKKLRDMGCFKKFETSIPPQSPVAWSNFITGMNPGGHGIFDFIHRDPKSYIPKFSMAGTEKGGRTISIGDWVIPLSSEKMKLLRKGTPFWTYLEKKGIPTTLFKVPVNFPPDKTSRRTLSGMGTPDILGTYGMYSYFSDNPPERKNFTGGKVYKV